MRERTGQGIRRRCRLGRKRTDDHGNKSQHPLAERMPALPSWLSGAHQIGQFFGSTDPGGSYEGVAFILEIQQLHLNREIRFAVAAIGDRSAETRVWCRGPRC